MGTASAVCSTCGAALARTDAKCPNCGLELVWSEPAGRTVSNVRCTVCGFGNAPGVEYCESCGARLTAAPPVSRPPRKARPSPRAPVGAQERTRKFEPWQILSVVAIVLLIAYIVYNEASRQEPRLLGGAPPAGASSPAAQPAVDLKPLEDAVKARPNDPGALIHLANALHDAGALPRAIEMYGRYLTIKPLDPDARVDMGSCLYQMGLLDTANAGTYFARALSEMNRAHVDNPTHQPAVFNMGVVNLQMGNLDESNRWFREAVKIDPNSGLGKRAQQLIDQHSFSR